MTMLFDADIAVKHGLKEAIVFQSIAYWVQKNEANEKHFHEGRYWTYNTVGALTKLFPFLSSKQMRTTLESLVNQGLIITGDFNEEALNHTTWYALTDYGLAICPRGQIELPQRANRASITSKNKILTEKEKGLLRNPKEKETDEFTQFWTAYPKKLNKKDAQKAFAKVTVDIETLLKAIEEQKKSDQWTKDKGKYIPYPATWLRGEQWENKFEDESPNRTDMSDLFTSILKGRGT